MSDRALVKEFSAGAGPETAAIVERLDAAIGRSPQPLETAIKWRRLTYAREGDFHHWLCAVAVTRRAVVLNFHFGGLLEDPNGRFIAGSSRFLRRLEYRSSEEVDEAVILGFVAQALDKLPYFKDNWKAIQAGALPEK
jgi:hypothetical protein